MCVCVADVKEESRHLDQSSVRQGRGKLKIFLTAFMELLPCIIFVKSNADPRLLRALRKTVAGGG